MLLNLNCGANFFCWSILTCAYFLFFVVNSSEDGWWEAENADGKQGVVPKTLLKVNTGNV